MGKTELACSHCGLVTCFDEGGSNVCEYATNLLRLAEHAGAKAAKLDEALTIISDLLRPLLHPDARVTHKQHNETVSAAVELLVAEGVMQDEP